MQIDGREEGDEPGFVVHTVADLISWLLSKRISNFSQSVKLAKNLSDCAAERAMLSSWADQPPRVVMRRERGIIKIGEKKMM